jgi:5-methylcytosine-specific restriction endonuclease McrA
MKKNISKTPRSKIQSALRQLWLRSRERAAALKRDKYCCQICGVKQSKKKGFEQKVEVHHTAGRVDWDALIQLIYERLLVDPAGLETLCPDCHDKKHLD